MRPSDIRIDPWDGHLEFTSCSSAHSIVGHWLVSYIIKKRPVYADKTKMIYYASVV